jgi:hypothetical protein
MRQLALGAWIAVCACHPQGARERVATSVASCEYRLRVEAEGLVQVDARCNASGPMRFRSAEPYLASSIRATSAAKSGSFRSDDGRLSYVVDLDHLARQGSGFDSAARVGASFVAAMSSVLLVPEPLTTEIPVEVRIEPAPGLSVTAGLKRNSEAGSYRIMAHEIPVATYFAFGKLEEKRLDVSGATLEVVKLDGKLDSSFDELSQWIQASAEAVRDFYRGFPVPRATVFVVPAAGRDDVVFGKVLPESQPGIGLVVGQRATRKKLYADWILVHELFHLGFPSFFEEGKWLDEGLATYYEPIIRVRSGLYTEREMWDEAEKSMPQGLPAYTRDGLEKADDFRGIYWGGALACFEADVEARKRQLDRGLEVGLRALRDAGGSASEVWAMSDALRTVDDALGSPTLGRIAALHAQSGSPFDLAGLLRDLGVTRAPDRSLKLDDSAPLAAIRRAMIEKQ